MSSEQDRPRSTRAPYVSEACDECRRRKIRCDGQEPCTHCADDATLTCLYTPQRRRARRDARRHINRTAHDTSGVARPTPTPTSPEQFRSPRAAAAPPPPVSESSPAHHEPEAAHQHRVTSSTLELTNPEFAVGVAGRQLQSSANATPVRSFSPPRHARAFATTHSLATMLLTDPLQNLALTEIMRLVHIYNNGPGAVYPVIGNEELLSAARTAKDILQSFTEPEKLPDASSALPSLSGPHAVELKLVLATASSLESCGINHFVRVVFNSVQPILQGFFFDTPSLALIRVWFLVSQLLFHVDQGLQASRVIAHAARLCQELSLHRPRILHDSSQDHQQGLLANKLVWSIFALDRRSAIDLGIPYVLQDDSIETSTTVEDDDLVYLKALTEISKLAGQVYHTAAPLSDRDSPIPVANINNIDERLLQWYSGVQSHPSLSATFLSHSRFTQATLFRNAVLYLRGNQSRNLLYRPVLYSAARIAAFPEYTRTAVETADEAINLLTTLIATQDMAQRNALLIKHFLLTAFSSLVLIVSVSSADRTIDLSATTRASLREAFGSAVELFRVLHARSAVFDVLWDRVQRLETLAKRSHLWSAAWSMIESETSSSSLTGNVHFSAASQAPYNGAVLHATSTFDVLQSDSADGTTFVPSIDPNNTEADAEFLAQTLDTWPQLSWDPALLALNANWAYV